MFSMDIESSALLCLDHKSQNGDGKKKKLKDVSLSCVFLLKTYYCSRTSALLATRLCTEAGQSSKYFHLHCLQMTTQKSARLTCRAEISEPPFKPCLPASSALAGEGEDFMESFTTRNQSYTQCSTEMFLCMCFLRYCASGYLPKGEISYGPFCGGSAESYLFFPSTSAIFLLVHQQAKSVWSRLLFASAVSKVYICASSEG